MSITPTLPPSPDDAVQRERGERTMEQLAHSTEQHKPRLSEQDVVDATDWFLSDEYIQPTTLPFELNVAPAGAPARWVRFKVRALGRDERKQIRKQTTNDTTGEQDGDLFNVLMAAKGLVSPDLTDERVRTVRLNERGQLDPQGEPQVLADATDVLLFRFGHKDGLIDRIAQKIMEVSGFDLDDYREADMRDVVAGKL
jgi:hypothetical protein